MKSRAETDLAHETETIPPGPAFRPDDSKIQGKPRGRESLISDLRDNMIPYTPEQLIAVANREFAWCENEMKQGLARDGLRRRLETGDRKGQTERRPARGSAAHDHGAAH